MENHCPQIEERHWWIQRPQLTGAEAQEQETPQDPLSGSFYAVYLLWLCFLYQLGVLHFNSFLTLTNCTLHQIPQIKDQSPQNDCQPQVRSAGYSHICLADYKVKASHNPLGFNNLQIQLSELTEGTRRVMTVLL